ncbi:Oligosaccaryltransferase-domain-containing protein [Tricharina praecox]|uniref:Oligosaccaryltransferase-domain-containing protein n=1 Tax=Tricharina praecox TaxID=43433 RepID=UPI00221E8CC2|nr:Oligosaccaryltransferase-domain-containing protein [Tricharina praecox]KAI5858043.1 Oligosaccaryltransferase-domain-containing protein [Tricharina praecox]
MITDKELNSLAIFLGTLTMSLIVLYHFLSVNSDKNSSRKKLEGAPVSVVVAK